MVRDLLKQHLDEMNYEELSAMRKLMQDDNMHLSDLPRHIEKTNSAHAQAIMGEIETGKRVEFYKEKYHELAEACRGVMAGSIPHKARAATMLMLEAKIKENADIL